MTDAERVESWFEAGTLQRPDPLRPSTVSLARALASLCGVDVDLDEPASQVRDAIGPAEHYVLVLADGLGLDLVEAAPADSFLRWHVAFEMAAVFPSSTAPALTSLASGAWPAEHGLLGWFVYLPDRGVQTVALPFRERFTHRPLNELGLTGDDLFGWRSLLASYRYDARLLMPEGIVDSVYTRAVSGGVPVDAYQSLDDAVAQLVGRVAASTEQTYTYFYYSKVDSVAHGLGPASQAVRAEVEALDRAVEGLTRRLAGRARIVVSADHGGIDLDGAAKILLHPRDRIAGLLDAPPSGEPRAPVFHVRPGAAEEFATGFRESFGERFALLTAAEVESMRLLGPAPLSSTAAARLGDFMALSAGGEALVYSPDHGIAEMTGFHGGLDAREVRIPLIVA